MMDLPKIVGVVLAGGRSTRFGSDKSMAMLAGRPLIEHVVLRAASQVDRLIVSANIDIPVKALAEFPVVRDDIGPSRGPLAGILAAMNWTARHLPGYVWLVSFPVDSPLFPSDLVTRLVEVAESERQPVIAASGGRAHPTFGLWPVSLRTALQQYLIESGKSAAMNFARTVRARKVVFSTIPFDPFLNINRREDLTAVSLAVQKLGTAL